MCVSVHASVSAGLFVSGFMSVGVSLCVVESWGRESGLRMGHKRI